MLGNGPVRFGGRPHGKGPAQRAPRRAAHPVHCVVGSAGREALAQAGIPVAAVALANQGETVLAWDPGTGRPLTPALVWQDRRAESICASLSASADTVAQRTGLVVDPYFSAPKMAWIRDESDHGEAWSRPPTPGWCTGCAERSSPTHRRPAGRC